MRLLVSDAALVPADAVFAEALRYLERRLGGVRPLEAGALPSSRAEAIAALDAWAGADAANWRRELVRFYEAHAPVHLAPDPALNAAVRQARRAGAQLVVFSPLPREAAELQLAHVGARRFAEAVVGEEDGEPLAAARAVLGDGELRRVDSREALLDALAAITPG